MMLSSLSLRIATLVALSFTSVSCNWIDSVTGRSSALRERDEPTDNATIVANSKETQTLSGSGELQSASVAFPPGSLGVDENVTLSQGGDLGAEALADLELNNTVTATGPSMIVDTEGDSDPTGTLAITLPTPASSGLNLQEATLVVVYRVVIKSLGTYLTGIIPATQFSAYDAEAGTITISSQYFGQFQAMYLEQPVLEKKEASSKTAGFSSTSGELIKSKTKSTTPGTDGDGNTTDGGDGGTVVPSDTTAPVATFATSAVAPTKSLPVPFTITFNEPIVGFTASDLSPSSGTISAFTKTANGYSFSVTAPNNGALTVTLPKGAVADGAGNVNNIATISIVVDTVAPTLTLVATNANPTLPLDAASLAVEGTCSEPGATIAITGGAAPVSATCSSAGIYNAVLDFGVSVQPGEAAVKAASTDAAGNLGEAEITVIKQFVLSVSPQFANAPNWMDYIRTGDPNTACNAASDNGFIQGDDAICWEGGERRQVVVGDYACSDVALYDNLAAFDWTCNDSGTPTFFTSVRKKGIWLSDLIKTDGSGFRPNFVSLKVNDELVASSVPSSTWWNNTFDTIAANNGSATSLSDPNAGDNIGHIVVIPNSVTLHSIVLNSIKLAVVVMPGATVTFNIASDNCDGTATSATGPGAKCLIMPWSSHFSWIEGSFYGASLDAYGIPTVGSHGLRIENFRMSGIGGATKSAVLLRNSSKILLHDVKIEKAAGPGIKYYQAEYSALYDVEIHDSGAGVEVAGTVASNNTIVDGLIVTNTTGSGIDITDLSSNWRMSRVLSTSHGYEAIGIEGSNVMVQHSLFGLSGKGIAMGPGSSGVDYLTLNNVLTVNNTTPVLRSNVDFLKITDIGHAESAVTVYTESTADPGTSVVDGSIIYDASSPVTTSAFTTTPTTVDTPVSGLFQNDGNVARASADFFDRTNPFKTYGRAGSPSGFEGSNVGVCGPADNDCQRYDWRVLSAYSGGFASLVPEYDPNAACPISEADTQVHNSTEYLPKAYEISFDGVGNDDGICNSNETCVYTPHLGVYQGEGDFHPDVCVYDNDNADGVVDVKLLGFIETRFTP